MGAGGLLFAPAYPFSLFSALFCDQGAEPGCTHGASGLTCHWFPVGFGRGEAQAGEEGRRESEAGCLGRAPFLPLPPRPGKVQARSLRLTVGHRTVLCGFPSCL